MLTVFLGQEWQYAMRREMQVCKCALDMASGKCRFVDVWIFELVRCEEMLQMLYATL